MPSRYLVVMRSYRQEDCRIARTLDIIGERWTILVLRDLFLQGPRRFQDLQESLAGVAPNTLSARLKTMEAHGLIASRLYSEHPPRLEYYLTEKGKSLGPVLKALREWGRRGSYRRYRQSYRRYRSDNDGVNRRYRGDRVVEYLYCASS
jgi:DNA-binding HxlR family transcriptional regulator